jgi:hypothetical protein
VIIKRSKSRKKETIGHRKHPNLTLTKTNFKSVFKNKYFNNPKHEKN